MKALRRIPDAGITLADHARHRPARDYTPPQYRRYAHLTDDEVRARLEDGDADNEA